MDFTNVISAVNVDMLIGALTAIAAIKILPGIAVWAYDSVIGWFGGGFADDIDRAEADAAYDDSQMAAFYEWHDNGGKWYSEEDANVSYEINMSDDD